MTTDKKFNIGFLEAFRIKYKRTIPHPIRLCISILLMMGIPIVLVIAIWQSIYTWWSIALFVVYFGLSGLSFIDWLIGKRHRQ